MLDDLHLIVSDDVVKLAHYTYITRAKSFLHAASGLDYEHLFFNIILLRDLLDETLLNHSENFLLLPEV